LVDRELTIFLFVIVVLVDSQERTSKKLSVFLLGQMTAILAQGSSDMGHIDHPAMNTEPDLVSSTQKQQYDRDGAIMMRNVLCESDYQDVMDDLQTRMQLLADREGVSFPKQGDLPRIGWLSECLQRLCQKDSRLQGVLYDAMSRSPAMHRMSSHTKLCEVVSGLMGPDFEVHARLILIMALPQAKWHLAGWHQDWYYNEGPQSTMTLWIPMHDVGIQGGALTVALGKHRNGLMGHCEEGDQTTKWHTIKQKHVDQFSDLVQVEAKAGDCLALHALAPHRAYVNMSSQVRFVLNFRYLDLRDPGYLESGWRVKQIDHARQALGRSSEPKVA